MISALFPARWVSDGPRHYNGRTPYWSSYAGATSTTSAPTILRSFRPCKIFFISLEVQPPISGVPVAGYRER